MSPNRAARRDKFKRVNAEHRQAYRDGRRLLTPTQIAWRDRLCDHQYDFRPAEVKWVSAPKHSDVRGMKHDAPLEYVERLYGPRTKTIQYTRTVRLDPD